MPQFKPRTHPARDHLDAAGRRWPGLWAACDAARQNGERPEHIYLTHDEVMRNLYNASALWPRAERQRVDTLPDAEFTQFLHQVTTLAAWRMTQGIYRLDPAVYDAVAATPMTGEIPAEILLRQPEWCIYVETPGGGTLRGFYARQDVIDDVPHLVITQDGADAEPGSLYTVAIPIHGRLDELLDTIGARIGVSPEGRAQAGQLFGGIINLLLYISSQGADISGKHGQPGNPAPVRTRRDGWRLFPADGLRTWDVGVRMGAALRAAYQAAETGQGGEQSGPRGHIRRAHWHGFRSGPRKRDDGSEIPTHLRRFDLRWLPPIPVNLGDVDELPATIRRV